MKISWTAGSCCWAPDEKKAFIEAVVLEVKDGKVTIKPEGDADDTNRRQFQAEELLPRARVDVGQECVANMDALGELNMASVLNNVELLFSETPAGAPGRGRNVIYSSVGPVLIALNPFAELPLYGPVWSQAYREAGDDAAQRERLGPHAFSTAEEVYQGLRKVKRQSVVICGESGAGKTVTNRKMLEYLVEGHQALPTRKVSTVASGRTSFKAGDTERITQANILLESFGNAKTVRNDNSSRFGKFSQLHFDSAEWCVQGFEIEHYLLERTRVVSTPHNERNYHIFYQLARSEDAHLYNVTGGAESFAYLKEGAGVEGFDDAEDFVNLKGTMGAAGFNEDKQRSIFEAIASVMHLGNVDFTGNDESSTVAETSFEALGKACALLGLDVENFKESLCKSLYQPPGNAAPILRPLSRTAAKAQRDIVSKMIYSRVFDQLIDTTNKSLMGRRAGDVAAVGLLDIFGFEDQPVNGFEQMYINLTNERIQGLFNSIMFKRESEAYEKEGITKVFDYPDNAACIELFTATKPPGIIKLLSDQCRGFSKDGEKFVNELNNAFAKKAKHEFYKVCDPQEVKEVIRTKRGKFGQKAVPNMDYRECFEVRHYAGVVMYKVEDFVSKSRDTLLPHLASVLYSSSKQSVAQLFQHEKEAGSKQKPSTVGDKFVKQLDVLATKLSEGNIVFVRCIKSNTKKLPKVIERPLVLEQLKCGGVVAALEMRHVGLPDRMEYRAFCSEFEGLERRGAMQWDSEQRCRLLLNDYLGDLAEEDQPYAFGYTKIFMKSGILSFIRSVLAIRLSHFVNVVRRRWFIHMGNERQKKIEEAWRKLEAVQILASKRGVEDVPKVKQSLQDCEDAIGPVWKALEKAKEEHGNDMTKIGADLHLFSGCLGNILKPIEATQKVIDHVTARKQKAEQQFTMTFSRNKQQASELLDRVASVEDECNAVAPEHVDPAEREACLKACQAARQHIEKLLKEDLPALQQKGPVGLNLEGNEVLGVAEPARDATKLLTQALSLLGEAEEQGKGFKATRREFQAAAEELEERITQARNSLKELQSDAKQCIAEGFDGIGENMDNAWNCEQEVENQKRAARDEAAFRTAVDNFIGAVQAAQGAVEQGKLWRERRQEEEEAQIDNILSGLGCCDELKSHGSACVSVLVKAIAEMREKYASGQTQIEEATPKNMSRSSLLSAMKPEDKILLRLGSAEESLRCLGISENDASSMMTFAPSVRGVWSLEQTHKFSTDSRANQADFLSKAKLLDKDTVISTSAAVDALNRGIFKCPEGFCIVFSRRKEAYFLIYRDDAKQTAFTTFGIED